MRNFNPNQSLRKGWRAIAALGALVAMAGAAYADGTDAGTSVENTFVLNYEVEGVVQPPITNDTDPPTQPPGAIVQGTPTLFTVDRLVDLTVAAVNSPLSVTPGASGPNATLVFEVTNTGNDTQSYTFSLQDGVDSNGAAGNFVLISGANAALCGADFNAVFTVLSNAVQFRVDRENKSGRFGDEQVLRIDLHALLFNALDFGEECPRIKHNAITNNGELSAAYNAARQE